MRFKENTDVAHYGGALKIEEIESIRHASHDGGGPNKAIELPNKAIPLPYETLRPVAIYTPRIAHEIHQRLSQKSSKSEIAVRDDDALPQGESKHVQFASSGSGRGDDDEGYGSGSERGDDDARSVSSHSSYSSVASGSRRSSFSSDVGEEKSDMEFDDDNRGSAARRPTSEKQHSVRRALRGLGQAIGYNVGKAATRAKNYANDKLLTARERYHAGSEHTEEKLDQKKEARDDRLIERIEGFRESSDAAKNSRKALIKKRLGVDHGKATNKKLKDITTDKTSKTAKKELKKGRKESKKLNKQIKAQDAKRGWFERRADQKQKRIGTPLRFEKSRTIWGGVKNIATGKHS